MSLKPIKILIIDDDTKTREIYSDVFMRNGFEVLEAEDGADGLEKARANHPDIIFTGIVMPNMDGITMMRELKNDIDLAQIPVAISSHLGRDEDREQAEELGAREFFIRGFDTPNEVVERIKALIRRPFYKIRFDELDLDAVKLRKDLGVSEFKCEKCGGKIILKLQIKDSDEGAFYARLACEDCD